MSRFKQYMSIIQETNEKKGTVNDIMEKLTDEFELDTHNNGGAYPDKIIFKKLIEIKNELKVINSSVLYEKLADELEKTFWAQNLGRTMKKHNGFEELEKVLLGEKKVQIQEMDEKFKSRLKLMKTKTLNSANAYRKDFSDDIFDEYKKILNPDEKNTFQLNMINFIEYLNKDNLAKIGIYKAFDKKNVDETIEKEIKKQLKNMHLEELKIDEHLQIVNILTVFQMAANQIASYEKSLAKKISDTFEKIVNTVSKKRK